MLRLASLGWCRYVGPIRSVGSLLGWGRCDGHRYRPSRADTVMLALIAFRPLLAIHGYALFACWRSAAGYSIKVDIILIRSAQSGRDAPWSSVQPGRQRTDLVDRYRQGLGRRASLNNGNSYFQRPINARIIAASNT